jgi:hypothetical protein
MGSVYSDGRAMLIAEGSKMAVLHKGYTGLLGVPWTTLCHKVDMASVDSLHARP